MRVREAKPDERGWVERMLGMLHYEVRGIIADGPKTRAYIAASVAKAFAGQGVVLIGEDDVGDDVIGPAGTLLAVEVDFPYDTNLGRTALGLGTYVVDWARKSGLAVQLYQEAGRLLKERGYKHYMGGHLVTNTQAQRVITRLGFEPLEVIGLFRLGD